MRIVIIVLIFILFNGCLNKNSKCSFSSNELLKKEGAKIFGTKKLGERIIEFRDKGSDSIKGGYYTFFDNGNLKNYRFFVDMETYIYSEEYDSVGNIIKVEGNPAVLNVANLIKDDSLVIKLYFFTLNKNYKKINIATSDNRTLDLKLLDDTLYSNMKVAYFDYSKLNTEEDLVSYIYAEYEDVCTQATRNFKDSIILHYKP